MQVVLQVFVSFWRHKCNGDRERMAHETEEQLVHNMFTLHLPSQSEDPVTPTGQNNSP
jgi:hypothetical protein